MNRTGRSRLFLYIFERCGGRAIQLGHGSNGGLQIGLGQALFLQRRCEHAGSDGFRQQQDVTRARAHVSPNSLRVDEARHRVAKLNIVIANRVAPNDGAFCFHHLRKSAANDGLQNLCIPLVGEAHNRERGNRVAAHGVNIAQGIGCRNLSEGVRIINDGGKEIDRLDQRHLRAEQIHPGVVVGIETNKHVRISGPRQTAQNGIQQPWTQLRRSTGSLDHGREFHGWGQVAPRS